MSRRKAIDFEILGANEVSAFFTELGQVPQKSVKKAARAGATLLRNKTKSSSLLPVRDGFLRASLKTVPEKKSKPGKAGYQVTFDSRFNSIFQKPIKDVGRYGGTKSTGYYPASMEYGFKHARGGVVGHYFMRQTAINQESAAQDKMLEVLSKDIDAIKKG